MGTTQRVASFIASARYEDVPRPAVDFAKLCLLDVIGCALYGSTRPAGKIMIGVVEELGGKPVSHVLGTGLKTNAVNAAMTTVSPVGTSALSRKNQDDGRLYASRKSAVMASTRSPAPGTRTRTSAGVFISRGASGPRARTHRRRGGGASDRAGS